MKARILFHFLMVFSVGMLVSCRALFPPKPTPTLRNVNIYDFLIGVSEMPQGWKVKEEPTTFYEVGAREAAGISFISDENVQRNGSFMHIYKFSTLDTATDVFKKIYRQGAFTYLPPDWSDPHVSSKQYWIGCYNWEGREPYACDWAAQYEEFVVYFSTWIVPGYMSFSDFGRVVNAIDLRMASKLNITDEVGKPGIPFTASPGITKRGTASVTLTLTPIRTPMPSITEAQAWDKVYEIHSQNACRFPSGWDDIPRGNNGLASWKFPSRWIRGKHAGPTSVDLADETADKLSYNT